MRRTIGAIILLGLVFTGCTEKNSSGTPTSPTTPTINLSGTWTGNVTILTISGVMTWTLTQSGGNVTGPVVLTQPTGFVLLNGFLTGTLSGSTLTYAISVGPGGIPSQPTCTGQLGGQLTATIGAPSTLVGTSNLTSSTCSAPVPGGPLTMTRQ
jgi:hypothetical protein